MFIGINNDVWINIIIKNNFNVFDVYILRQTSKEFYIFFKKNKFFSSLMIELFKPEEFNMDVYTIGKLIHPPRLKDKNFLYIKMNNYIDIKKKCLIKSIIHNEINIIKWLFDPEEYKIDNNNNEVAELIFHVVVNDRIELLKILCENEFISKYILENDSFIKHITSVEMINFFLKKKEKKFDIDKNIKHYLMVNSNDPNKIRTTGQIIISMLNVQYSDLKIFAENSDNELDNNNTGFARTSSGPCPDDDRKATMSDPGEARTSRWQNHDDYNGNDSMVCFYNQFTKYFEILVEYKPAFRNEILKWYNNHNDLVNPILKRFGDSEKKLLILD
jgi:hypothetical protein